MMSRSGTISIRSLFTIEWMISFVVDYVGWWCLVSSSDQVREHTELLCCSQLWHTVGTSSYCSALVKLLYSGQHNSDTAILWLISPPSGRRINIQLVSTILHVLALRKCRQQAQISLYEQQQYSAPRQMRSMFAVCLLASNGGLI